MNYRGRFAPSPTGPLHLGSLMAAAVGFLDARQNHGEWLVRIEDIDPPRETAGAADLILRQLDALGLTWDGPVLYQSTRREAYQARIDTLIRSGQAFRCSCSRSDIRMHPGSGPLGSRYPGTCREGPTRRRPVSVRARTDSALIEFDDRFQGRQQQNLAIERGDYVIQRRDGLPAYHLAVVVDDDYQQITDVVRGIDLLDSSFAHLHLQGLLGVAHPRYAHLPVLVDAAGDKLSKQTGAAPVSFEDPAGAICQILAYLGAPPPAEIRQERPEQIWRWAIGAVHLTKLGGLRSIPSD
jgi:glutamyl-Q tRNA(Asp) synthetase